MGDRKKYFVDRSSAAFISAALVMFIALGWFFAGHARAQAPLEIQGQLSNGTHDAPAHSIANVPITLFQITTAGPITRSAQTDAQGSFSFANVITDANAYFTRVDYAGIRYFSEIRPPELAAVSPFSMTVYETQTLPANFTFDRVHLILDVQPRRFNGLELVQITNASDRAFYAALPLPDNTSDVQFQDIREQSIVKRQDDGTILYPILPTTSELLFGIILPYTPPDYELKVTLGANVAGFNLLVSESSGVRVTGNQLAQGEPFTSQSGQRYLVYSGPEQRAGTTFTATISNLPGVDNTRSLQTMLLLGGGASALALLAYPVYRRRAQKIKADESNERVAQLQALARLDDAFDAGELEESEYQAQRAMLKAELLKNAVGRVLP